ncbi:hypothetical protein ACFWA0_09695, partial [Streptomyces xanthophaeus]
MREAAIIEAPSVLGLRPSGVEDLPTALLDAGLLDGAGALRAARMPAPAAVHRGGRAAGGRA